MYRGELRHYHLTDSRFRNIPFLQKCVWLVYLDQAVFLSLEARFTLLRREDGDRDDRNRWKLEKLDIINKRKMDLELCR